MNQWQAIEAFLARFYGGRVPGGPAGGGLLITPYGYPISFTNVAAGASQQQVINISANADFLLIGIRHRTRLAAAGQTVSSKPAPIATLLLVDSGSNEQFTQAPVDLENYGSNDAKVLNLPYPRLINGRTTITAQLANYAPAAEAIYTQVYLDGVNVRAY